MKGYRHENFIISGLGPNGVSQVRKSFFGLIKSREGTEFRDAKNSLGADILGCNYTALFSSVGQIRSEKGEVRGCFDCLGSLEWSEWSLSIITRNAPNWSLSLRP